MSGKFTIHMECNMINDKENLLEYLKTAVPQIEESLRYAPFLIKSIGFSITDSLKDFEDLKNDILSLKGGEI